MPVPQNIVKKYSLEGDYPIENAEAAISDLYAFSKKLAIINSEQKAKLEALEQQNAELELLKAEIATLRAASAEKELLQEQFDSLSASYNRLSEECGTRREKIAQLEVEKEKLTGEVKVLKEDNEKLYDEFMSQKKENASLDSMLNSVSSEHRADGNAIRAAAEENKRLSNEIQTVKAEKDRLCTEKAELAARTEALEAEIAALKADIAGRAENNDPTEIKNAQDSIPAQQTAQQTAIPAVGKTEAEPAKTDDEVYNELSRVLGMLMNDEAAKEEAKPFSFDIPKDPEPAADEQPVIPEISFTDTETAQAHPAAEPEAQEPVPAEDSAPEYEYAAPQAETPAEAVPEEPLADEAQEHAVEAAAEAIPEKEKEDTPVPADEYIPVPPVYAPDEYNPAEPLAPQEPEEVPEPVTDKADAPAKEAEVIGDADIFGNSAADAAGNESKAPERSSAGSLMAAIRAGRKKKEDADIGILTGDAEQTDGRSMGDMKNSLARIRNKISKDGK